jgi:hypothetical protein
MDNVQKVCHFKNTSSSQTFRIYVTFSYKKTKLWGITNFVPLGYIMIKAISHLTGHACSILHISAGWMTKMLIFSFKFWISSVNVVTLTVPLQTNYILHLWYIHLPNACSLSFIKNFQNVRNLSSHYYTCDVLISVGSLIINLIQHNYFDVHIFQVPYLSTSSKYLNCFLFSLRNCVIWLLNDNWLFSKTTYVVALSVSSKHLKF